MISKNISKILNRPSVQTKNHFVEFDLLRALSIIYIIIHHMGDYDSNYNINFFDQIFTYIALGTFIFISGYLVSLSAPTLSNWEDIGKFLSKKFLRLYPLYLIAVTFFVIYKIHSLNIIITISHIFLVNMILSPRFGESYETIWFISLIFLYYFFYIFASYKSKYFTYSIIKFILILVTLILGRCFLDLVDIRLIIYLPLFIAGIFSNKYPKFVNPFLVGRKVYIFIFLDLLTIFLYSLSNILIISYFLQIIFMVLSIPILWKMAKWIISNTKSTWFFSQIAFASYCMYLFHRFIFRALLLVYLPNQIWGIFLYLFFIGLPITFIIGYLTQGLYDLLLKHLSKPSRKSSIAD